MNNDVVNRLIELAIQIQQIPAPTFQEKKRAEFVQGLFLAERLNDVCIDETGNVFVTGWSLLPGTPTNPPSWFWVVRKLAFQPQLSGTPSSGELRLSWPTNTINFVLQSATTLANGGDWQRVGQWTFPAGWNRVLLSRRGPAGVVVVGDAVRLR